MDVLSCKILVNVGWGDKNNFSLFCFKDQFISQQVCVEHCIEPLLDLINV